MNPSYHHLTTDPNIEVCGPKGGRLLEIFHLGLPVPPLACVPALTYRAHVSQIEEYSKYFLSDACILDVDQTMEMAAVIQKKLLEIELDPSLVQDISHFFSTVPCGSVGIFVYFNIIYFINLCFQFVLVETEWYHSIFFRFFTTLINTASGSKFLRWS